MRVMIIDKTDVNDQNALTGKGSEDHPAYKNKTRVEIPSPHHNHHPYLWTVLGYIWAWGLNVITNYITY